MQTNLKEQFSALAYPTKKIEIWRFADFTAFSKENIESFLLSKKEVLGKKFSFFDFDGLPKKDFYKLNFGGNSFAEFADENLSLKRGDSCGEFEDFGKMGLLAAARADGVLELNIAQALQKGVLIKLANNAAFSPLALKISVQKNASAEIYIENCVPENSFADFVSHIELGENAKLKISYLNNTDANSLLYAKHIFCLNDNSSLEFYNVQTGQSSSRCEASFLFKGTNAVLKGKAFVRNSASCKHDFCSEQIHKTKSCKSFLDVKNVLDNSAKAAFMGVVHISESGELCEAKQSCKTLLLSENAKVQASPVLEICANDVECSHGCAVSMPEPEQVFYLNSRGLNDIQAKKLIAEAFANYSQALPKTEEI